MSLDSAERSSANRFLSDGDVENTSFSSPSVEFLNELMFRGPAIEMAQRHAASGGRTYLYTWLVPLVGNDTKYGACHGAEVCYVLNTGRQIKHGEAPDPQLANQVQQMWVNFATTGNPSIPGHYWPAYDTTQRASMLIASDTLMVENDRLAGQRRLIAPLMREYIFSDLLDKAPWYLGIAIGTLVAALLLLTWLIIRIRRLFNPSKKSKSSR